MIKLKSRLKAIKGDNKLRNHVIDYVLHYYKEDDIKSFFKDITHYGCISGMIGHLIYYADTHKFYDKYYEEIEELREEYQDMSGMTLNPQGDLKNWYAWFGFEQTACQIANELDIL